MQEEGIGICFLWLSVFPLAGFGSDTTLKKIFYAFFGIALISLIIEKAEVPMKKPFLQFCRIFTFCLLIGLIFLCSFYACSKSKPIDIVKEIFKAWNNHDAKKTLTYFTDNIEFRMTGAKASGKDESRKALEYKAVIKSKILISDISADGNTVFLKIIEKNDINRLLEIEEDQLTATVYFRENLIEKINIARTPESEELGIEKFGDVLQWYRNSDPQVYSRIIQGEYAAYNVENAKIWLTFLKRWRSSIKN